MKAIKSLIKFFLMMWLIVSVVLSMMVTFESADSDAYWWALNHKRGFIVCEIEKSVVSDDGTYGLSEGRYYIAYNAPMKPYNTVYSLIVYNPCNNYEDDILLVCDAGGVR